MYWELYSRYIITYTRILPQSVVRNGVLALALAPSPSPSPSPSLSGFDQKHAFFRFALGLPQKSFSKSPSLPNMVFSPIFWGQGVA